MNRFLTFSLLLVLTSACWAQQSVSTWNSSTGSTVQIVLNSKADPTRVQLLSKGRKTIEHNVSKVSTDWFEYRVRETTMRATFASANEIIVSGGGNNYRWTRRNSKVDAPIPNGEKCEKSYWRTDDSEKKYLLLLSPSSCSVMSATPSQGKQRYHSLRAKWVKYPSALLVETEPPRTFHFRNSMLFKDGTTHWYRSSSVKDKSK